MPNVIDIRELTKVYRSGISRRGIVALDSVSFAVPQGEIFGLLGPNGAGKTTLFKVLLGIAHAASGSAQLCDLPAGHPGSRQKVGYLPENHRFPSHLTGLGLLQLTGRLHGMCGSEISQRARQLLAMVGMEKWATFKIRKYSKGMAQRVGLAQALICDPEVLLLDEPTDGVDPVGKTEIREVLTKVRDEGKTIVLNSHLLAEVESVADRVAILQRGKVLRVSSVEDLTSRQSQYEIEAEIGSQLVDIPEDMGKRVALTSKRLIVELKTPSDINWVIDQLRMKRINIISVKPVKVSLEQSFIETLSSKQEPSA